MSFSAITIKNKLGELAKASAFTDDFAAANKIAAGVAADVHVALDEVLTNIIKYGYTDECAHEIHIQLTMKGGVLEAQIEDDGRPFDPLLVPEPDLSAPLQERRVGGLGIHFVRNLMNDVRYDRVGNRNRLVLKKNIRP